MCHRLDGVGATYSQNAKTLEEYYDFLDQGQFPVVRGLALSRDDLVRRAVIMALMCQGRLSFESIELAYLLNFRQYFAKELEILNAQVEQGLVCPDATGVQVTAKGWFLSGRSPWCLIATCRLTVPAHAFPKSSKLQACKLLCSSSATLMGLAGGSHCIGMCGAACAGIGQAAGDRRLSAMWTFQLGRVIGYSALGAVAAASMQGLGWLTVQSAALRPVWTMFHVAVMVVGLMLVWNAQQPIWLEAVGKRNRRRHVAWWRDAAFQGH